MGDTSPQKEYILCLLPLPEDEKIIDIIRKKHPNVTISYRPVTYENWKAKGLDLIPDETWQETTILFTLLTFPSDPKKVPNLKLVHLLSAGTDRLHETPVWKDTDILITNSSGVSATQIAEWVVMQILTNSHKEKLLLEWQKKHFWGTHSQIGLAKDLIGQKLGVLGYGAIGRQTARVCKAMGMDVIAFTAGPRTTPESKKDLGYVVPNTGDPDGLIPSEWYSGLEKASLHTFLRQDIDILLISVPLTPQTQDLLGAEELELLGKKNAFIVNIARGGVIKTEDLMAALKKSPEEGGLRGAALDVTDPEPLPEDSPLWDMENVAITPHVSGLGISYSQRSFEILEQNLTLIEKGEKLINIVDRKKGY